MSKYKYIEWDKEKVEEWLKDKIVDRTLSVDEFVFLSEFIRNLKPKCILEVGTFLGLASYVMATSSPNLETFITIDNLYPHPPYTADQYGMYLHEGSIFIKDDYRNVLDNLLEKYKPEFVFLDDGHGSLVLRDQLERCYNKKIKYVAVHDTNQRGPRLAVNYIVKNRKYEIIAENKNDEIRGLTILKLVSD